MDARKTIGAGRLRPALGSIHSDSPDLSRPLSAEQIYREYGARVYHIARRMVSSDVDAEDVTQDVLLQVVRKLPTFRGDAAFPTWLHRVTINAALSHRRRQALREEHGVGAPTEEESPDGTPPPDDQIVDREVRQLIDQAVESLPQEYRTVFVLADVEGMSNADIAEQLEMSLPAVKSRLHRARGMLREALAPHFSGG